MCVLCDGGSEEDLLRSEFMRIAVDGYTVVFVESESPWCYTIGLQQSFDQPELVVTGRNEEHCAHVLVPLLERITNGERFSSSSPPIDTCDCTTVSFGPVHPAQWARGRFDQWVRFYDWAGVEPPAQRAIQVLWPNSYGEFPTGGPEFCTTHRGACQPLLDDEPRHNVHSGTNREQRRRAKHGHGKRRRP